MPDADWDIAVIGAGPAGLAAARAGAAADARTVVLERAAHPRYKTCGGGLIGLSLAAAGAHIDVPARQTVDKLTFTLGGRREFTRRGERLLRMVQRAEFDTALRDAAIKAGAVVRERLTVRAVISDDDRATVRLADGSEIAARTVVGADGSAGVTGAFVGVRCDQVDLGLEVELPVSGALARRWSGRVLLDWGPIPGSYAWVFPKGDSLSVGVIAARGLGAQTKAYLRGFRHRLALDGIAPTHDSGHLTRCRADDSPLSRGRVIVAGDAAGLLDPWTREGISFALRSGELAGTAAATGDPASYVDAVHESLVPDMAAGRRLLHAYVRRPAAFHAALATPLGFLAFSRFVHGEMTFGSLLRHRAARAALATIGPGGGW
jgi:geranylgeranyl reductase family protein